MDSQDYRLLLDLYEEKSITLLAQRYFLSQPALTKRIQRMEEELGCTLLHRRKRGVTFTAAGERMLTYCREMLHMEQELREDLNRSKGVVGGSLSILCSNSYSYYRLPMALKQYRARCPQVRVQVTVGRSAALYQQLLRREDCVAILRGEWAWGDGRAALASEPLCLVCSRENESRPLRDYPYISHATDDRAAISQVERWAAERELPIYNAGLVVNHISCCRELVRLGLGWSILPRTSVNGFDGTVQNLYFLDGEPLRRGTFLLYHSAYYALEQVRLFAKTLQETDRHLDA